MTIIKATEMEGRIGVRGLLLSNQKRSVPAPVPDPAQLELASLRERLEALTGQLGAREAELADLRQSLAKTREESLTQGRLKGIEEAESREAERLQALEKALGQAGSDLATRLDALEPLALLVARESLDKILGDPTAYGELITRIVRHQLDGLKEQSVLSVDVSAEDFHDRESLDRLAADLGRPVVSVVANEELASGACQIRLKLGVVEVGVRRQWEQLGRLLGELAEERGP